MSSRAQTHPATKPAIMQVLVNRTSSFAWGRRLRPRSAVVEVVVDTERHTWRAATACAPLSRASPGSGRASMDARVCPARPAQAACRCRTEVPTPRARVAQRLRHLRARRRSRVGASADRRSACSSKSLRSRSSPRTTCASGWPLTWASSPARSGPHRHYFPPLPSTAPVAACARAEPRPAPSRCKCGSRTAGSASATRRVRPSRA